MTAPLVSILIPTRNGAAFLPRVLKSIRAQQAAFPFEVIAVDSGSTDGTVELLRRSADRLIEIPPTEFGHGTARNTGIRACLGELVVLLVQDAEPASPDWLTRLTQPLLAAGDGALGAAATPPLAGTYGRQIPRADASPVAREYLSRYMTADDTTRVQAISERTSFESLAPLERLALCRFDNVCSCIRREVWLRYPFAAVPIAEDLQWARDVMLAGYGIVYVPGAAVLHSHDRPAGYELRRTYLVHKQLRRLFGLATVRTAAQLGRAVAVSTAAHARWTIAGSGSTFARLSCLPRALALAFAMPLGQYLGARSADTGREFLRARGV